MVYWFKCQGLFFDKILIMMEWYKTVVDIE